MYILPVLAIASASEVQSRYDTCVVVVARSRYDAILHSHNSNVYYLVGAGHPVCMSVNLCVYIQMCVCVCECVCVKERETACVHVCAGV